MYFWFWFTKTLLEYRGWVWPDLWEIYKIKPRGYSWIKRGQNRHSEKEQDTRPSSGEATISQNLNTLKQGWIIMTYYLLTTQNYPCKFVYVPIKVWVRSQTLHTEVSKNQSWTRPLFLCCTQWICPKLSWEILSHHPYYHFMKIDGTGNWQSFN